MAPKPHGTEKQNFKFVSLHAANENRVWLNQVPWNAAFQFVFEHGTGSIAKATVLGTSAYVVPV